MTSHYVVFGIANCDQVKKARQWLGVHHIDYHFHDLKKEPVSMALLSVWAKQVGWQALLKKTGTTWRNLPSVDTQDLNEERAIELMFTHYNLIKRPLLVKDDHVTLMGFKEVEWHERLT